MSARDVNERSPAALAAEGLLTKYRMRSVSRNRPSRAAMGRLLSTDAPMPSGADAQPLCAPAYNPRATNARGPSKGLELSGRDERMLSRGRREWSHVALCVMRNNVPALMEWGSPLICAECRLQ